MAIGWITGIVLFALLVGAAVFGGIKLYKAYDAREYHSGQEEKAKKLSKQGVSLILASVLILVVFICVPFSFHTVDSGEVAVIKRLGEAREVKGPGLSYNFWMVNTYEYIDTKTQEITIETMAYSSDAQVMTIQMTVQYSMRGDKAVDIVKQYGSAEALKSRITSIITETPKSVVANRTAMNIIANRSEITPEVQDAIVSAINDKYYVTINKVTITNIDFSDAFESAVEEKMIAEQAKLKADYENETKIAKAEADAKAKVTAAKAEAEANELLQKTLTDKILQEMYLDKWDGKLPQVVAGDDTSMILPSYNTGE